MDVTMSSPVNECLGVGNDAVSADAKVTKAQKRNRIKILKEQFEANQENTETPKSKPEVHFKISSLSSHPDTGRVSNPGAPGVEKGSILGIENDNGNGAVKLDKSKKREKRRKSNKKEMDSNQEDAEKSSFSKSEDHAKVADGEMGLRVTANLNAEVKVQNKLETVVGETGSGTNATDDSTSRRQKRKKSKKKKPDSDDILSSHESTQNTLMAKNVNVKGKAEEQNKMETAIGETVSGPSATHDMSGPNATTNVNVKGMAEEQSKMETAIGETSSAPNATDDSSKKQKRKKSKNKNPGLSDILITHESTQDMVLAKNDSSTTTNVNMTEMVEEQNKMETTICGSGPSATDDTGSGPNATTNVNVKGMAEEQNKMEMAIGETSSAPNATDDSSKKQKRKKSKNKNPGSSDILIAHESTQDMVLAKNDSSTTTNVNMRGMVEEQNKMEMAICGSGPNATDDASKKKKRKKSKNKNPGSSDILCTHERTHDTVMAKNNSSETTNVNVKGIAEEQNKLKATIGETGSGKNTTDDTSKKRERKVLENKNLGSSDFSSTHESMLEEVIAKNDSSTTINFNMKGMTEEQNKMETGVGETGSGTNTTGNTTSKKQKRKKLTGSVDSLSTHKSTLETVIGKNDSPATTNVNLKGMAEEQNKPKSESGSTMVGDILNPQYLHNLEPSKGEMGSGTATKDNTSSKKKRQKSKNPSPALGDIVGTHESREDVVIEKIEASTTNVLAAVSGQMLVKRTQGEEHKKVGAGKTGSSAVTKVNDSGKKKKKPKKEKRPTLGEILNPQYLVSSAAEVKAVDITEAAAKDKALITKVRTERKEKQKMGIREVFQVAKLGKKLIVLDVNGLLADIVSPRPKDVKADVYVPRKAIFKRPFMEDFLCFCFERFNVGIWSSRTKENLDNMVDALLGDLRKKLLFLWDASECSKTGIRALGAGYKCIVFRNLRKIWERDDPNGCWVKGTFNASNTLLLDDSPYKALLNPKHNGLFPFTYSYKNRNDDFLGPEGELRTYLEGLAACDNVKMYVQQHPLGQGAIDEEHRYWGFYKKVLRGVRPQFSSKFQNALEELELLQELDALQEPEILQQS